MLSYLCAGISVTVRIDGERVDGPVAWARLADKATGGLAETAPRGGIRDVK